MVARNKIIGGASLGPHGILPQDVSHARHRDCISIIRQDQMQRRSVHKPPPARDLRELRRLMAAQGKDHPLSWAGLPEHPAERRAEIVDLVVSKSRFHWFLGRKDEKSLV